MESIDLLIYCLIIVAIVAFAFCIIYQILKYAANRDINERDTVLLPLHEKRSLVDTDAQARQNTPKPGLSAKEKRRQYVISKVDEFIKLSITKCSSNSGRYCESLNEIFQLIITDRDTVIQAGMIPYFVKLLDDFDILIYATYGTRKTGLSTCAASKLYYLSLTDNKKCIQIFIDEGCIPTLVRKLNDNDSEIRKCCAFTLANIRSKCEPQYHDYIDGCIIPALISLLKFNENKQRMNAAESIGRISSTFIWDSILKTDVIPLLVKLLNSQNVEICKISCEALRFLGKGKLGDELYNFEGKEVVIKAGALPLLVKLMQSNNPELCKTATQPLIEISLGTFEQRQAIIDALTVPHLTKLLSSTVKNIRISATQLLVNLTPCEALLPDIINASPLVIKNLNSNDKVLIFTSFMLLKNISYGVSNECQTMFEANVISNLKAFLDSEDLKIVQMTLIILDNISDKLQWSITDMATPDIVKHLIKFVSVTTKKETPSNENSDTPQNNSMTIISIDDAKFLTTKSYDLMPNEIQKRAVKILYKIASGSTEQRRMIIESNGIPEFVKLICSTDKTISRVVIDTLNIFVKNVESDKAFLIKANCLQHIERHQKFINPVFEELLLKWDTGVPRKLI